MTDGVLISYCELALSDETDEEFETISELMLDELSALLDNDEIALNDEISTTEDALEDVAELVETDDDWTELADEFATELELDDKMLELELSELAELDEELETEPVSTVDELLEEDVEEDVWVITFLSNKICNWSPSTHTSLPSDFLAQRFFATTLSCPKTIPKAEANLPTTHEKSPS